MVQVAKRRWCAFSLRAMFMVVGILCVWLAWQANIIRERRLLLQSLTSDPHLTFDPLHTFFGSDQTVLTFDGLEMKPSPTVPWFRRILGDRAVVVLGLPSQMTDADMRRFRRAFPETHISQELPGRHFSSPAKQGR